MQKLIQLISVIKRNFLICGTGKPNWPIDTINQRHQKKLFNLWHRQAKLAPDCITVLGNITSSVHERNALQFGLKHHILAKSFDTDRVKAEIESTVDSAVWKTNTKVNFDFRDDVKRCFFDFEEKSKLILQSKRNVALHRTLLKLSRNKV